MKIEKEIYRDGQDEQDEQIINPKSEIQNLKSN